MEDWSFMWVAVHHVLLVIFSLKFICLAGWNCLWRTHRCIWRLSHGWFTRDFNRKLMGFTPSSHSLHTTLYCHYHQPYDIVIFFIILSISSSTLSSSTQGICAENIAKVMQISREEQDEYAVESYRRSQNAAQKGIFKKEIVPVVVKDRKGFEIVWCCNLCAFWYLL